MNNSSTGGYLTPTNTAIPGGLTLNQFIQTVIVGISGYTNTLVRPKWQQNAPKQPDIGTDWIAFGIKIDAVPGFAFVGENADGQTATLSRQEQLRIDCRFYGPNAQENAAAFRDGFQVQQNLEAMRAAKMGFSGSGEIQHMPDLVNGRWVEAYMVEIELCRQVQRSYQILLFASVGGTIHTVVDGADVAEVFVTPELV